MKRCQFCGWNNPSESEKCEKCGLPLDSKVQKAKTAEKKADEKKDDTEQNQQEEHPATSAKTQIWHKGTLKPNRRKTPRTPEAPAQPMNVDTEGQFTLMMMPDDGEDFMPYASKFEGHEVILNRSNTESSNKTITGKKQARLTNVDNKWFIEDCSEMKTTFVRSAQKIELHSGDLILMGDRVFRFDDLNDPADLDE